MCTKIVTVNICSVYKQDLKTTQISNIKNSQYTHQSTIYLQENIKTFSSLFLDGTGGYCVKGNKLEGKKQMQGNRTYLCYTKPQNKGRDHIEQ